MQLKKVLRGHTVMLRPMVEADLTTRAHWLLDSDIREIVGMLERPAYSYQNALSDCYKWLSEKKTSGDFLWAIDVDGKLIGDITAHVFEYERRGEMFILIGDKAFWGKGYAKEACSLVLDEIFKESDIYYMDTFINPGNNRSYSLALSLGFAPAGTHTNGVKVLRVIKKAWLARRQASMFS